MFDTMKGEIKRIIDSILELTYFMRGSVSYEYALMNMSVAERDRAFTFINKRLDSESKSAYPVY